MSFISFHDAGRAATRKILEFIRPNPERLLFKKEYLAHLNAQALSLQRPLSFLAIIAWLAFAFQMDPKLHPEFPELLYFRLALSAAGLIVFAVSFTRGFRGRGLGWLYFIGVFLLLSCSFFTGRLADDPSYVSGLQLIILILIIIPITFRALCIFYVLSILLFAAAVLLHRPDISSFPVRYSLNNLTLAYLIGFIVGLLMDKLRFRMFINQHDLNRANQDLQEARDALWGEMELAKRIQTVLLPVRPAVRGYDISASMDPAREVGGDYYDIINAGDRDWIIIGDVAGHGLSAGLIMMMVHSSINSIISQNLALEPADILEAINRSISESIKRIDEEKFMTMTVLSHRGEGRFVFSGLHQDILLYRAAASAVEIVETEGSLIGMAEIANTPINRTLTMESGDVMVLYTDGVTEAWKKGTTPGKRDPKEDMFGIDGIRDILLALGGRGSEEIRSGILTALMEYEWSDDVTLLVVKRLE
jgi:serine phosphatase RsbU (regulator of sigma subunit)